MKNVKKFLIAVLFVLGCACAFSACGKKKTQTPSTPTEYQIMYSDGISTHTITVKSGDLYSITEIPHKEGYTFLGWFDAQEYGKQYISHEGMCTEPFSDKNNILLYPQYKANEYTIALEYGVGEKGVGSVTVCSDAKMDNLPVVYTAGANYGFEFQGWYTEENCGGMKITGADAVSLYTFDKSFREMAGASGTIRLYAGFQAKNHVVRFFDQAGNLIASMDVPHGTTLTDIAPKNNNGYAIAEWSRWLNGSAFMGNIESSMDLYVLSYAHTVTLDTRGGLTQQPLLVAQGKSVVLPRAVRSGYSFLHWVDGANQRLDTAFTPTGDCTVYAVWEANTYHVTLNTDNGASLDVQNVVYGEEYEFPAPTAGKDGYAFLGWKTEQGDLLTNASGVSVKAWDIANDTTLYASYAKYVTVYFNSNGGTAVASKTVVEGTSVDLPIIQKSGYVLEYWTVDGKNYTGKYKAYSDVTLSATWFCCTGTYRNATSLKIEDEHTTVNPYDSFSITNIFGKSLAQIRAMGFTKVYCTLSVAIKEDNDGYQEVYFGKSRRLDVDLSGDRAIWGNNKIEGSKERVNSFSFTAGLADFYETMYICYSANGTLGDTWYRKSVQLTMVLS